MSKLTAYDSHASTIVPRGHGAVDEAQKNVLHEPLLQHSSRASYPMASKSIPATLFKAGFCDAQTPIAAELTQTFLDTASKSGVNLKQMGVRPGQKWCVETSKWKEAMEKSGSGGDGVPRVRLEATHESALKGVELDELKKWSFDA
ncbi:hypothetical protein BKA63DRAFT_593718 [Paraphoma chrysanthemicola]|nr:hypothetical protein BKA63DRAFT_593718 [Paraphoma chrysanthemicola]